MKVRSSCFFFRSMKLCLGLIESDLRLDLCRSSDFMETEMVRQTLQVMQGRNGNYNHNFLVEYITI